MHCHTTGTIKPAKAGSYSGMVAPISSIVGIFCFFNGITSDQLENYVITEMDLKLFKSSVIPNENQY